MMLKHNAGIQYENTILKQHTKTRNSKTNTETHHNTKPL